MSGELHLYHALVLPSESESNDESIKEKLKSHEPLLYSHLYSKNKKSDIDSPSDRNTQSSSKKVLAQNVAAYPRPSVGTSESVKVVIKNKAKINY